MGGTWVRVSITCLLLRLLFLCCFFFADSLLLFGLFAFVRSVLFFDCFVLVCFVLFCLLCFVSFVSFCFVFFVFFFGFVSFRCVSFLDIVVSCRAVSSRAVSFVVSCRAVQLPFLVLCRDISSRAVTVAVVPCRLLVSCRAMKLSRRAVSTIYSLVMPFLVSHRTVSFRSVPCRAICRVVPRHFFLCRVVCRRAVYSCRVMLYRDIVAVSFPLGRAVPRAVVAP